MLMSHAAPSGPTCMRRISSEALYVQDGPIALAGLQRETRYPNDARPRERRGTCLGQLEAVALAAGEHGELLLLVRPLEVEPGAVGAHVDLAAPEVQLLCSLPNLLIHLESPYKSGMHSRLAEHIR